MEVRFEAIRDEKVRERAARYVRTNGLDAEEFWRLVSLLHESFEDGALHEQQIHIDSLEREWLKAEDRIHELEKIRKTQTVQEDDGEA